MLDRKQNIELSFEMKFRALKKLIADNIELNSTDSEAEILAYLKSAAADRKIVEDIKIEILNELHYNKIVYNKIRERRKSFF